MQCPSCKAIVPVESKFCGQCGTALPSFCPSCGHANPAQNKYCSECGAFLTSSTSQPAARLPSRSAQAIPTPTAERRQITIMFCDIVGSTTRSTLMDPEDLRELLATYHTCVADVVSQYAGFVAQYLGDGALVFFGYPQAHEDDSERAVRAALALVDAVPKLKTHGQPLEVRIGIATGPVIAGEIIGAVAAPETGAVGETPNLAARLQALAAPNTIVIAQSTQRLLGSLFEYRDLGSSELKGFAEPIQAWQVLRSTAMKTRFEASRSGERPLVGRRLELEQLRTIIEACRDTRRGRAVYLRGEAGIGKTRLLHEFLLLSRQTGFACHTGLVLDFGTGTGRDAIRALARDILGLSPTSSPEMALASSVSALTGGFVQREDAVFLNDLLGIAQPMELRALYDAMDNNTRNVGKRRTMTRLVERASSVQPRVLAVEDLHWADPSTLAHLAALTTIIANCPAVLVMTSRLDQDPIDQVWRAGAGARPLITIDIGALYPEEADLLAAPILGAATEVAKRCIERAAGNPLFLEQLLRNAAEGANSAVPGSVQSLVQARLDRLDPADKAALQVASVLGQRFDGGALAHLLEQSGYAPERLLSHHMVRTQGEEFLFAHALIHEAIYDGLLKSRRRQLHRRAAEWFAPRDATLRAQHLDRAEDPTAPKAYLDAARSQVAEFRYETARQLVERGLALGTNQEDQRALGYFYGNILHDLGDMPAALSAFERVLGTVGNDTERCRALIGCAQVKRVTDDLDGAFADLERAEKIAVALRLQLEEARIKFLRGNLFFPRGDIEGCLREHGRSLELARQIGAIENEAAALGGLGDAEFMRGRMINAHDRLSECVQLAKDHGFGRIEVANRAQITHTMLYFKPQREVWELAVAAATSAARVGHLRAELNARLAVIFSLFALNELEACRAEIERGRELVGRLGAWRFETPCLLYLGKIALCEGRSNEATSVLRQAQEMTRRTGVEFFGPAVQGALALALNRIDERRAALAEGEQQIALGCVGLNQLRFYPDAIDVALELSDWDEMDRYASQLEAYTRTEPLPWSDFFINRGRLLAAVGRGTHDHNQQSALSELLDQGERLGYMSAIPALRKAFAACPDG